MNETIFLTSIYFVLGNSIVFVDLAVLWNTVCNIHFNIVKPFINRLCDGFWQFIYRLIELVLHAYCIDR
jgi:hypothetical protein